MGNNEGSVDDTLKERGNVYGNYGDVLKARTEIMGILQRRYIEVNDEFIPEEIFVGIGDIVLKLVRAAGSPHHADSFHDLQGYAKLMEDYVNE